jgi:hypothetical protein
LVTSYSVDVQLFQTLVEFNQDVSLFDRIALFEPPLRHDAGNGRTQRGIQDRFGNAWSGDRLGFEVESKQIAEQK